MEASRPLLIILPHVEIQHRRKTTLRRRGRRTVKTIQQNFLNENPNIEQHVTLNEEEGGSITKIENAPSRFDMGTQTLTDLDLQIKSDHQIINVDNKDDH